MESRDVFTGLRERARNNPKKIILVEGQDDRVVEAARIILKEEIARLIIFDAGLLKKVFRKELGAGYLELVDVTRGTVINKYASLYFELRKSKGVDLDMAKKMLMDNPVYIAALMVKEGIADGFVAGASLTTRDVARAAIHCIGKKNDTSTILGIFIMSIPDSEYGEKGTFVFADCAVLPQPDRDQLADIAVLSADFTKDILKIAPRVAMLSYSSKGSGSSERTGPITEAVRIAASRRPDLLIDGELQVDAAIVPEVAKTKAPDSPVAGFANVLVFPNLEAANCSYKLVQRLAKARAVGPIFLGLGRPASDLSRGCNVEDIVDAVAVTVVRAQENADGRR